MLTSKWKPSEEILKEYYIKSSRFYFVDKMIFASMFTACDDIYYLPDDHPDWVQLSKHKRTLTIDED